MEERSRGIPNPLSHESLQWRFDWQSLDSYDRSLSAMPEAVAWYNGHGERENYFDVSCFASADDFIPYRAGELPSADGEFID